MNRGREERVLNEFWKERIGVLKSSKRTVPETRKVGRTFKARKRERDQRSWGKNENHHVINLKGKGRLRTCLIS